MSSYKLNNYSLVFELFIKQFNPKTIVEFGILDGYSLDIFAKFSPPSTQIYAFDLFEDFIGNASEEKKIRERFKIFPNVFIEKLDFLQSLPIVTKLGRIDLMHIDVANNGKIYEFAVKNILPLCDFMILEGGSKERDNVEWMKKYKKKSIHPFLDKLKLKTHNFYTIDQFPSLTIFYKVE